MQISRIILTHKKWLLIAAVLVSLLAGGVVLASTIMIDRYEQYVLRDSAAKQARSQPVGLVLGAGITPDGKPYRELQGRLDTAAEAMKAGYVERLIVSGDNRFPGYDEPTAMKQYLVRERGLPADKIQPDFAGRSTYESCERAAKVFKLDKVILISAGSHLPRAIYLCRHFGVETYGIASATEAGNASRREAMARVKAMFNVYVRGEKTILGSPIPVR